MINLLLHMRVYTGVSHLHMIEVMIRLESVSERDWGNSKPSGEVETHSIKYHLTTEVRQHFEN